MKRGELWWANLDPPWGRRPVLLLARDEAYALLSGVAVAPVTSHVRAIRTWVALEPGSDGVPRRSAINLDAIQVIAPRRIDQFITALRPSKAAEVDLAVHFALGIRRCPR